jgi:hypothetical protein
MRGTRITPFILPSYLRLQIQTVRSISWDEFVELRVACRQEGAHESDVRAMEMWSIPKPKSGSETADTA